MSNDKKPTHEELMERVRVTGQALLEAAAEESAKPRVSLSDVVRELQMLNEKLDALLRWARRS